MFTDPTKNLKMLGLRETDIVADLGAGTGFYTIALSSLVPRGKVYAIEVVKDFLETIRNKAKEKKLNNIETLVGNIEKSGGTKLGDSVVDAVVASNVLFEVEDKDSFVKEINRILKHKGKLLLIDWSPDSLLINTGITVPKEQARAMFKNKGFVLDREIDAGSHHYGMIFIKE